MMLAGTCGCASGSKGGNHNTNAAHDAGMDANSPVDADPAEAGIDAARDAQEQEAGADGGSPDAGDGSTDAGGGCTMPSEACTNGAEDRDSCATARTLSRASLPFDESGIDIAAATDARDPSCIPNDSTNQKDHFYRIFLLQGEQLTVRAWPMIMEGFNIALALYRSPSPCSTVGCDLEEKCVNAYNNDSSDFPEVFVHTVADTGWYVISVDSRLITGTKYRLRVEVDCAGTCGC